MSHIAQECCIPGRNDAKADVPMLVRSWLEKGHQSEWLMILDNADDTYMFFGSSGVVSHEDATTNQQAPKGQIARYIPECSHGSVLITTRNRETGVWLAPARDDIEIEELSLAESTELLKSLINSDHQNPDDLDRLAQRLERLPLALAQAGAYINMRSTTVSKYLELLEHSDETVIKMLSEPFQAIGRDSGVPHAVTAAWVVSFEQIREQYHNASDILCLMSFFDRQDIPKAFLSCPFVPQRYQQPELRRQVCILVPFELEDAVGILKGFSFVTENVNKENLNMHRLVHLVMRKWLIQQGTAKLWAGQALLIISELYPDEILTSWEICKEYLPHALMVLSHKGLRTSAEEEAKGLLLGKLGYFMSTNGQDKKAVELYLQALLVERKVSGENHPNTVMAMSELAKAYVADGSSPEAEALMERVVALSLELNGAEHSNTLRYMRAQAWIYVVQERWEQAVDLLLRVIKTQEKVLGAEDNYTLVSKGYLAMVYEGKKRWKEAEELLLQVVEAYEKTSRAEHPNMLISISELARVCYCQRRLKEAAELEMQNLEVKKRVLGPDHPYTLSSMNNLAIYQKEQGHHAEGQTLMEDCHHLRLQTLGADHPHTKFSAARLMEWKREDTGTGPLAIKDAESRE